MKCPFCERPLKVTRLYGKTNDPAHMFSSFVCAEESCWIDKEFPRYMGTINDNGELGSEEYAVGKFYAKVYPTGTCIYRMMSHVLMDEVRIPRALWLNLTNTDATLDKLKFCVTFS